MSLTDKELRAEGLPVRFSENGYVEVNSTVAERLEKDGLWINFGNGVDYALTIEEATALRDGLTVVIDQYHDFIARRDTKTNQEIIDEMEPGTVFRFDWHEGGRIYSKGTNGKVYSHFSGTFLDTSSFGNESTITVVNQ